MGSARLRAQGYRSLGAVLLLVTLGVTGIMSCGDGGSSNGGLCDQCGDDPDGPCQSTDAVVPGPDAPAPCKTPGAASCTVELTCLRKLGSSQRRCFAASDPLFECDGARPNPNTVTPMPTATPTETEEPETPTPTVTTTL